jgi:hypothetical protein
MDRHTSRRVSVVGYYAPSGLPPCSAVNPLTQAAGLGCAIAPPWGLTALVSTARLKLGKSKPQSQLKVLARAVKIEICSEAKKEFHEDGHSPQLSRC